MKIKQSLKSCQSIWGSRNLCTNCQVQTYSRVVDQKIRLLISQAESSGIPPSSLHKYYFLKVKLALNLLGLSSQINVRPEGRGEGKYCPPRICLILTRLGLSQNFYMKYDLLYMLYRPNSNIWNSAHVDQHSLARHIND